MSTAPISDGKYKDRWSIPGSAERNSIPINEAITPLSTRLSSEIKGRTPSILEIASGMGTQISTIAKSNPNIIFQPTETDLYLKSQIDSRVKEMGVEKNVRKTKILDLLEESDWKRLVVGSSSDSGSNSDGNESESSGSLKSLFDGVLICNLTHICPFEVTQSFFAHLDPRVEYQDDKNGAQTILNQNHGLIAIYGPFNERGGFTSEGNRKVSFAFCQTFIEDLNY